MEEWVSRSPTEVKSEVLEKLVKDEKYKWGYHLVKVDANIQFYMKLMSRINTKKIDNGMVRVEAVFMENI